MSTTVSWRTPLIGVALVALASLAACGDAMPTDTDYEALAPADALLAKGNAPARVDICHLDDEGEYQLITVAQPAVDAHRAHGDIDPTGGECGLLPF